MDCKQALEALYRYLDNDMENLSCDEIKKHLDCCRHCWNRFEFEQKLKARLKTCCQDDTCTDALRQRVKKLLDNF